MGKKATIAIGVSSLLAGLAGGYLFAGGSIPLPGGKKIQLPKKAKGEAKPTASK